jgi:hypothetical protein
MDRDRLMDRWIAGFLQLSAGVLTFMGGALSATTDDVFGLLLLPAAGLGAAGLALWARGARSAPAVSKAAPPPPAIEPDRAKLEEMLASLQADVAALRDEREFLHELYAGSPERARALGERTGR